MQWQEYNAFVKNLIGETARRSTQSMLRMQTYAQGDQGVIVVEDFAPNSEFLNVYAKVATPDGEDQNVELKQTGPRRYEGRFQLGGQGRYQVMALGKSGKREERMHGGFVVPYSAEFRRFRSNPINLNLIRDTTGGRDLDGTETGKDIFTIPRTAVQSSRPVFDWFLILLACLIPLDVAVRRVQIDWQTIKDLLGMTKAAAPSEETFSQLLRKKETVEGRLRHDEEAEALLASDFDALEAERAELARQKQMEARLDDAKTSPHSEEEIAPSSTTERLLARKRRAREEKEEGE